MESHKVIKYGHQGLTNQADKEPDNVGLNIILKVRQVKFNVGKDEIKHYPDNKICHVKDAVTVKPRFEEIENSIKQEKKRSYAKEPTLIQRLYDLVEQRMDKEKQNVAGHKPVVAV